MDFLVDHNIGGHAKVLAGSLSSIDLPELVTVRFFTFQDFDLPIDSNDRIVWRIAQSKQMILLTANRSMEGEDSLEQVLREENTLNSLPIITLADADRFMSDRIYRTRCVSNLANILTRVEDFRGVGRLFI